MKKLFAIDIDIGTTAHVKKIWSSTRKMPAVPAKSAGATNLP